jgi:hypothetical protein
MAKYLEGSKFAATGTVMQRMMTKIA